MTVKGGRGAVRTELEWPLTAAQFEAAWTHTENRRITKTRYRIPVDAGSAKQAEVDVFHGDLAGLVLAEVEFESDDAMRCFTPPDWFGREVTDDPDFANASLATRSSVSLDRLLAG